MTKREVKDFFLWERVIYEMEKANRSPENIIKALKQFGEAEFERISIGLEAIENDKCVNCREPVRKHSIFCSECNPFKGKK